MAYKINIRNTGNTGWVNLLEAQYHEVLDAGSRFTATTVEAVLAELFDNKVQRVETTTSPGASNDTYQVGTVWVNTTNDNVFICVDKSSGAAIWINLSSLDTEGIQDIAGGLITDGTKQNITVTYNDASDRIDFSVATADTTTLGVASFDSDFFTVTAGAVSMAAGGITVTELASNIDATAIGFNADKVDGKDVNDTLINTSTLWTSQKIKDYTDGLAVGLEWQAAVLDKDLDDPPASPTTGDRYIISAGTPLATGVWLGQDNSIAEWDGTQWVFTAVTEGMATWVVDEDVVMVNNGTDWAKIGTTITHANLIGLQGGGGQFSGDLYHITGAEHTALTGSKAANTFFGAPDGAAGVGGFRLLVSDDIPSLLSGKITDFDEAAQDAIGAMVDGNTETNISVTYDDTANKLNFAVPAATTTTLGVASFDSNFFSVTAGAVTLTTSAVDHGNLSGLGDDDHPHYVHVSTARSITAQHTFAPASAQAPFVLSANAQGQLVTGLNADLLNGQDWTVAVTASAPTSPAANDIWVEITA